MGRKKKEPGVKLPAIKQLPSGSWRTRIYIDGRTVSITKDTYDECAAEYLALKNGIVRAQKKAAKGKTLEIAINEYINSREGLRSPVHNRRIPERCEEYISARYELGRVHDL